MKEKLTKLRKYLPWIATGLLVAAAFFLASQQPVLARGEHYTITESGKEEYTVQLRNAQGESVKRYVSKLGHRPEVEELEGGILEVRIPVAPEDWQGTYYDPTADQFSPTYNSPLGSGEGMVVLAEYGRGINCIVVRDMMSGKTILAVECDFAPYPRLSEAVHGVAFPSADAVEVTYEMGDDFTVITETFPLAGADAAS